MHLWVIIKALCKCGVNGMGAFIYRSPKRKDYCRWNATLNGGCKGVYLQDILIFWKIESEMVEYK
jgi:hypothetical protein